MNAMTSLLLLLLTATAVLNADDNAKDSLAKDSDSQNEIDKYIKKGTAGNQVGPCTLTAAEGVTGEVYFDVLNSLLVAQHACTAKYGEDGIYKQTEKWYKYFSIALKTMGWITAGLDFTKVDTRNTGFNMDESVITMMESLLSTLLSPIPALNAISAVKKVLKALESLAVDGKIKVFSDLEQDHEDGQWQIGVVHQDRFGVANLSLGCMRFHLHERDTNFLFWEYKARDMDLFTSTENMVLDPDRWAAFKSGILEFVDDKKQAKKEEKTILAIPGDTSETMSSRINISDDFVASFCAHIDQNTQQ